MCVPAMQLKEEIIKIGQKIGCFGLEPEDATDSEYDEKAAPAPVPEVIVKVRSFLCLSP